MFEYLWTAEGDEVGTTDPDINVYMVDIGTQTREHTAVTTSDPGLDCEKGKGKAS